MQGQSRNAFVAREETLCYLLPKAVALDLIQANPRFAAFFYLELSRKLDALARDEEDSRVGTLMRARIARHRACLRPPSSMPTTPSRPPAAA